MKTCIISGSHRLNSQSRKVADHIQQTLLAESVCEEAEIFSLEGNPLPLWDQGIWENEEQWETLLAPLRRMLQESDALVIIAPEWHGQVPAGLKNFFLIVGKNEVGHKPALIVTVSSADGGAYPVAELRMSSYKNNRICYIPEQVIVRNVESVLNENPEDNNPDADRYFRERILWSLKVLRAYADALKPVRESGITSNDQFGFGM
ncbi:NADPH-dependent FMN reductase [Thiolapillus brandeum]|uniref:NADPH-dependent FMN reductase n=1 Tax=Thiolapillus brandeum TaxID=1076588 RepID=A0A7U6JKC4_9GAMM|nr:NAD(P)H-dependent oxidoreductase [Thiolapillus brandeum]BAO45325.1 NADPH-dependent FMN reductase [Thiolapillus brandeum]